MENLARITVRYTVCVIAVCVFGGWAIIATPGLASHARLQAEIALDRKVGMPVQASDIPVRNVEPGQNAAPLYAKFDAQLTRIAAEYEQQMRMQGLSDGAGVPANQLFCTDTPAVKDEAARRSKHVLEKLPELDRHPLVGYDRNAIGLQDPAYDSTSKLELAVLDAAEQASGDWKEALRLLCYATRIASDNRAQPGFLGLQSEADSKVRVLREYEALIGFHSRDKVFLQALAKQLPDCEKLPDIRGHLGQQIILDLSRLPTTSPFSGLRVEDDDPFKSDLSIAEKAQKTYFQSPEIQNELRTRMLSAWRAAWQQFPAAPDDWRAYAKALQHVSEIQQTDRSLLNSVNRSTFSGAPDCLTRIGLLQAHARMVQVSLGLLAHRNEMGTYPDQLPAGLGSVGLDPFDGCALRYRRLGRGFILYSIGEDREDDGGHIRSMTGEPGTGYDEVVQF